VEHTSPYIPACTITTEQEVVLFRIPTVAPMVLSGFAMMFSKRIASSAKLLLVLMGPIVHALSTDFFDQESAASITFAPFHAKHVWQPHLVGPVMLYMTWRLTFWQPSTPTKDV